MKHIFIFLILLIGSKTFSQEFNDRIYPKDEDSIACKITSVEKNWIYYDHFKKSKIKNDYIHMSDIKFYIYYGVKKKPYEQEVKTIQLPTKEVPDNSPKDTIKSYYLDSLNIKHSALFLVSKNKTKRISNQYRKLELIDSTGNPEVLHPDKIEGYWLSETYFKSFKTNYKGKMINFFAQELTSGKAALYIYDGAKMDNKSIYIFKKQSEVEYNYVQEILSNASEFGSTAGKKPNAGGPSTETPAIVFADEEPYLNYFQSYFSDCQEVLVKFKSKFYSYSNVTAMFIDYNNCM